MFAAAGKEALGMRLLCHGRGRTGPDPAGRGLHRAALLDEVHRCEKKIVCLDYLVYRIKQNQQKRED